MNIFVCGDSRGHHTAIVLRIDKNPDTEYPISLETGEMLTRDNCTKLAKGRFGNRFKHERLLRGVREEMTEKSAQSDVLSSVYHGEAEHRSNSSNNTKALRKSSTGSALSPVMALKGRPSEETAIETAHTEGAILDDEGDSRQAVLTSRTLSTAVFQSVRSVNVGEPPMEPVASEEKTQWCLSCNFQPQPCYKNLRNVYFLPAVWICGRVKFRIAQRVTKLMEKDAQVRKK
ncbi:hypothetical protein PC120_g22607 [Phytophthora cactorum]|nr:hypothetical protein PC120_g22607 [Phytophthora cactorum]